MPCIQGEAATIARDVSVWDLCGSGDFDRIGQSEEQVRASGIPYECGIARFRETSRGHIMGVNSGFLKLIFALDSRRLLGAHIVGEGATELIHIGQAVINLHGTVDFFV